MLNNCMNNNDFNTNKREQQHIIATKTKHSNALTADWLRDNGINENQLNTGVSEILQAQKLATFVLANFGRMLARNQADALNNFLKAAASKVLRKKITQGACFKVLNIAKQAQRKFSNKLNTQHSTLNTKTQH